MHSVANSCSSSAHAPSPTSRTILHLATLPCRRRLCDSKALHCLCDSKACLSVAYRQHDTQCSLTGYEPLKHSLFLFLNKSFSFSSVPTLSLPILSLPPSTLRSPRTQGEVTPKTMRCR